MCLIKVADFDFDFFAYFGFGGGRLGGDALEGKPGAGVLAQPQQLPAPRQTVPGVVKANVAFVTAGVVGMNAGIYQSLPKSCQIIQPELNLHLQVLCLEATAVPHTLYRLFPFGIAHDY